MKKKPKPKTEGGSIVSLMFSAQNLYKSAFEHFVKDVCTAFSKEHVKVKKMAPVMCKAIERTFYKTYYVYKGDHTQLTDLLRCSFVFDSFIDLYKAFGVFEKVAGARSDMKGGVLRAKDRFDPAAMPFGYRDLLVNVMCPGTSVVCEIQFHHKIFYDSKKDSHYVYKRARLFDVGDKNMAYEYVTEHIKTKIPPEQKYVSRFGTEDDDEGGGHKAKVVGVLDLLKEWLPDKSSEDGVSGLTEDGKLVSYYQILKDQGYDTVDGMKDLTDDDLKEMKFKPGHRKQFIKSRDHYFQALVEKEQKEKEEKEKEEKEKDTVITTITTTKQTEVIEEDSSGLRENANYSKFLASERIFLICGALGGSKGGGGVYCVETSSSQRYTCIREDGYNNAHSLCRIGNDKLYAACGTCFGAQGGGGIWEIDVPTGKESELCSGFQNCTVMTNLGDVIYATCGVAGGGDGAGGLYRVDPRTGKQEEVGSDWQNSTVMSRTGGKIYIVCGKAYGADGGGGLYEVDPRMSSRSTQVSKDWQNSTHMTTIGKYLYIVCGLPGGGGGCWEVDPATGRSAEVGSGWKYASCMLGLEDTKRIYICNGIARGQEQRDYTTPSNAGLYCFDPAKPRDGFQTLQTSGWVNSTLMA